MKNIDWNDLHIFLHVVRGNGLTGAAKSLESSAATVGRRMLALEQAIGQALFIRRQTGYALTKVGEALYDKVVGMEASARPIANWLDDSNRSVVRISAGTWTANFLAANFSRLWTPEDPFRIAFKTTEARLDIAHREVEIGLRNSAPAEQNLAAQRTVVVAQAPFRARNLTPARAEEWVLISPDDHATQSARWAAARPGISVAAWANTPRTLHDLIRAGVGTGLLPCFAGDRDPELERAGEEILELRNYQWVVMHNDDRHRTDVRTVIDRIVALSFAHSALFAGERRIGDGPPEASERPLPTENQTRSAR